MITIAAEEVKSDQILLEDGQEEHLIAISRADLKVAVVVYEVVDEVLEMTSAAGDQ